MIMKIPFMKKQQAKKTFHYSGENFPDHVAIIMDGNGRWAQKQGLPRFAGHKEGVSTIVKVVRMAVQCKIKVLTLYAFSTENWKRPKSEVEFILKLPKQFLDIYLPELISNNVRVNVIGDMNDLPDYTRHAVQYAMDRTRNNDGLQLNFALNYGSRNEIMNAMKDMVRDMINDGISVDQIDEQQFTKYLSTANMSDPDLLIRTGGEKRLSNFLLWQLAYTEFWFTDVLWPDFDEEDFLLALEDYRQRERRYGKV